MFLQSKAENHEEEERKRYVFEHYFVDGVCLPTATQIACSQQQVLDAEAQAAAAVAEPAAPKPAAPQPAKGLRHGLPGLIPGIARHDTSSGGELAASVQQKTVALAPAPSRMEQAVALDVVTPAAAEGRQGHCGTCTAAKGPATTTQATTTTMTVGDGNAGFFGAGSFFGNLRQLLQRKPPLCSLHSSHDHYAARPLSRRS